MKTFFAVVCILFLITGCATPSNTVSSSTTSPPTEPVQVDTPYLLQLQKYELSGYIKNEDGHPLSAISVVFKNRVTGETTQTNTNNEGYFTFSIKGNGHLHINDSENNPLFIKIINRLLFLKMKGLVKVGINEYQKEDKLFIVLPYNVWVTRFKEIKRLYEAEDYKQVIDIGHQFQIEYKDIKEAPTSEVESILNIAKIKLAEKEMVSAYAAIISLNKNEEYEGIILYGNNYIGKYRDVKGSKWEEIDKVVRDAYITKREKLFNVVMNLNKKEDYESIISQGKDYIEKYRNEKGSKWEEMEKLVREAEVSKLYKEMEEEFLSIMNLNKNESYEFIIERGKSYIENYRDVKNSKWTKITELVKEAEIRKRKVEEEIRKEWDDRRKAEEEERKKTERERLRVEKKEKDRSARCDNVIMSMEQFYRNNNPYADKGKCVDIAASSFQMSSANTGLFKITYELVYIEFKETFRGRFVKGVAKILGIYSYPTRLGGYNSVPHLKMLEIERVE